MRNHILIAGYIGFGNAGDEAIAEIIVRHLREEIPGVEITILSGNPAHTASAFGVHAIGWREPLQIATAIRDADLTIIGGGGLFHDYWGFDPNAVMTRGHWGLSFYVAPAMVAAIFGKPVMLYAVGAGPLLSEHGRRFTKVAGDLATRLTVRDQVSQDLFESLGVRSEKMTLTADPAFDIWPTPLEPAPPEIKHWAAGKPAIALCLRGWTFGADRTFCEREIATALDSVLEAESDALALFLPFHVEPGTDDDFAAAHRIHAMLRHQNRTTLLTQRFSPGELVAVIGQANLVLGMRLHSIIFSLTARVPFVALEYDPKIGGLAGLTSLEEYTIPYGGVEADLLAQRMRQALANAGPLREAFGTIHDDLRRRCRTNASLAAEILREGVAAPDLTAEAHIALGRLLLTQIGANETWHDCVQSSFAALDEPLPAGTPEAMTAALVTKAKTLQALHREAGKTVETLRAELAAAAEAHRNLETSNRQAEETLQGEALAARRETEALKNRLEGQLARLEADLKRYRQEAEAAQTRLETEGRKNLELNTDLYAARGARQQAEVQLGKLHTALATERARIAALESKTPGGIAKRALQVGLDTLQLIIPESLRALFRKQYLNQFYYRIYPERRPSAGA